MTTPDQDPRSDHRVEPRAETAAAALGVVGERLARVVGADTVAGLAAFAERIPSRLTGYLGVELRLEAPGGGADLLAYLERPEALADPGVRAALAPDGPDLARVRDALHTAPRRMSRPLEHGWLEWDLAGAGSGRPSVFAAPASAEGGDGAIVAAHRALGGDPAGTRMRAGAAALARAVAGRGRVMQVGVMAAPRAGGCRVVLSGADPAALVDAAVEAGWPGPRADAERLAARASGLGLAGSALDLDLGARGLLPSLGIELTVTDRASHQRLLDALVTDGRCAPALAAALADWRIIATDDGGPAFPARLRRTRAFLGPHVRVAVMGWLNHVKIALPGDGPGAAKAYLGIRERVVPAG